MHLKKIIITLLVTSLNLYTAANNIDSHSNEIIEKEWKEELKEG